MCDVDVFFSRQMLRGNVSVSSYQPCGCFAKDFNTFSVDFCLLMNKAIRKDRTELKNTTKYTGTDDWGMTECIEYGMFSNLVIRYRGAKFKCSLRVILICSISHMLSVYHFCLELVVILRTT